MMGGICTRQTFYPDYITEQWATDSDISKETHSSQWWCASHSHEKKNKNKIKTIFGFIRVKLRDIESKRKEQRIEKHKHTLTILHLMCRLHKIYAPANC